MREKNEQMMQIINTSLQIDSRIEQGILAIDDECADYEANQYAIE